MYINYFCFNNICLHGVILVSLLKFPFRVQVISCVYSPVCRLQLFSFHFRFQGLFLVCSYVGCKLFCIVINFLVLYSVCLNSCHIHFQGLFLVCSYVGCKLFCIVINFLVLYSVCLSSCHIHFQGLFLVCSYVGCKAFCIVINFLVLYSVCLSSCHVHFKNVPGYLYKGDCPSVFFFDEIFCCWIWFLEMFSFIFAYLMVSAKIFYPVSFSPLFTMRMDKFHSYILVVYSYCLYLGLYFFFIFNKCFFYIIHVHKVINIF